MEINPDVRARFDPVAAESAALYKLSRSPDMPRRLRVALRVSYQSITTYDDRATFDSIDIDTIKAEIRNRIFKHGINANGEQMAPAQEVKNKRGLYRYDTGRLWQSLRVKVVRPGTLEMSWEYPGIILGALEERYGPIFEWSDSDEAFVDDVAAGIIRDLDVEGDQDISETAPQVAEARGAGRAEQRRIKKEQQEAAKKAAEENRARKAEQQKVIDEVNQREGKTQERKDDERAHAEAGNIQSPQERAADIEPRLAPIRYARLTFTSAHRFTEIEMHALTVMIRNRIINRELDAAGRRYPKDFADKMNRATLDSILVRQMGGSLREIILQYSLRNPALYDDPRAAQVFAWSNTEIKAVKAIIVGGLPPGSGVVVSRA